MYIATNTLSLSLFQVKKDHLKRISSVKHHNKVDRQKSEVASKIYTCTCNMLLLYILIVQGINLPTPKMEPPQGPIVR